MFQANFVEEIKIQILYLIFFFENHAVYDIMWKNIVNSGSPQMAVLRVAIACWINKVTDTHSEYVILISLPLQQWLLERASMLRYMHIASLIQIS
jgi:hypothetical protein